MLEILFCTYIFTHNALSVQPKTQNKNTMEKYTQIQTTGKFMALSCTHGNLLDEKAFAGFMKEKKKFQNISIHQKQSFSTNQKYYMVSNAQKVLFASTISVLWLRGK